jgi:hypothetical protein
MKWLWTALPSVSLFLVVPALAENKPDTKPRIEIAASELAPTQEMWFYEQYQKQYTDPKSVVRQKAEFRAEERQRRIAALRWFGFSNQRPTAGVDVINSEYAPHWAANNVNLPFRWCGPTTTTVIVKPAAPSGRTY